MWHRAEFVDVHLPMTAVYRGPTGPQPRAYLMGTGYVAMYGAHAVLSPRRLSHPSVEAK
jgi:hypothetical protein